MIMKTISFITLLLLIITITSSVLKAENGKDPDVMDILKRYAVDYEKDPTFTKDLIFGVKVDEKFWHIKASAKTDSTVARVDVHEGEPPSPSFYFFTDTETLLKIDKEQLNALTGAAKAFSTDNAPFDVGVMEGFVPDQQFMSTLLSVFFHFWTRGTPEIIPYGIDFTRYTHGAQASVFFYQPGFRSAYVALKKGQHANKNENSRTNPFYSMLILIKGDVVMIINGNESVLEEGKAVVIPPGTSHEFINKDSDTPVEAILLMFGEGA